jgi:hypothetical protein
VGQRKCLQFDDTKNQELQQLMMKASRINWRYAPPEAAEPYSNKPFLIIKNYLTELHIFETIAVRGLSSLTQDNLSFIKNKLELFYNDFKQELDDQEHRLKPAANTAVPSEQKSDAELITHFNSPVFQQPTSTIPQPERKSTPLPLSS